ncbi:glyoxysomal processing protease, glyoxysomal isoform X2 [Cynara cardunculus var. scolymus]|uniref:glyoxysomal processing protease, glyoxysomal isoform X2 n=1 Tax=Cynara cardunculus var. scolymus TaxID=59895 RepID=UPI000D62B82D|nr:glyoxysomal processing protease, glyoxysomal isoform X2 [Cynara cardunculus var. scolymus]
MGLPEIVEVARNFSLMIRVQGPDPKGLKMRKHAFHHYMSGKTTLSASGMVLPSSFNVGPLAEQVSSEPMSLVLTVASIIEPFLSSKHRDHMFQVKPELISGAQIDVMVEGNAKATNSETLHWLPAELITLAPRTSVRSQREMLREQSIDSSLMGKLATRIAILKLSSRTFEDLPNLNMSPAKKRGDLLLAMGAPFGILSPAHFCNSISVGYVSNCYPSSSSHVSLLMADIRCLPGMEGSPVFGEQSEIVGMLTRPLRQRVSGAEVQLVIPWEAIVMACDGFQLPNTVNLKDSLKHAHEYLCSFEVPPNPVEKAMSSICLVTIGDGVWASGVLLNNHGLILTNAHLLEPWRFKKTGANENHEVVSNIFFTHSNETGDWPPTKQEAKPGSFQSNFNKTIHQRIRVRVDYLDRWIWCDASILYVSKGPLDIAVLQLNVVPDKLQPIIMDFTCPSPGSKVYVIGHGLFGPRCDMSPSACVGVVAKVVKVRRSIGETGQGDLPVMIETTAAVHPGGSGGAILNSNGHMISLVTSNARHGGGTIIPYLNFSIPCAALEPLFHFSKDMKDLSILEDLDRPNEHLSSVWALMPPLSPKPDPPLPDKETKGSRFAKFIAQRQQMLKQTSPSDKMDRDSSKFLPSKL